MMSPAQPTRGDLVFVKPQLDDRVGQFVARLTNGPFCHVRIILDDSQQAIEADGFAGVRLTRAPFNPSYEEVAYTSLRMSPIYRQHGIGWVMRQQGHAYSWWDIAADGVKLLLPQRLGSRTPFLVAPSQYDCSSLATLFLLFGGYQWLPDEIAINPTQVSPNDLARAVGLLK